MDDEHSQIPTGNSQVSKRSEATVLEYADFIGSNISAMYVPMPMLSDVLVHKCLITDTMVTYVLVHRYLPM